jgi:iron(III) transport system substrate-binding protein
MTAFLVLAVGMPMSAMSAEDAAWQKVVEAGKKEGVVNLASSGLSGKAGVEVSKAFKDKYGISLELIPGRIANSIEKIRMEQQSKSYVTDAVDTVAAYVMILKNAGFLESVAGALPVLKEKDKFARQVIEDPEAQLLAVLEGFLALWVNTGFVKPGQEPTSLADLADPRWKGKLILVNPLYSAAPTEQMTVFGNAYKGFDKDFFVKLYKGAQLSGTGTTQEAIDKVMRGEFQIGGPVAGATAVKPFLEGAPIKPLDLKEGTLVMPLRWGAIKNAPHPNATKVFINWMLSREGQLLISKATGLEGVRNDIPSVIPFQFKGPKLNLTYELMILADKRFSENYLPNLLGIKR